MDKGYFNERMQGVYAAHGKGPTKQQVEAVWERVRNFPDSFMVWAAKHLCDLAALPNNLGQHLEFSLWPQWRRENPQHFTSRLDAAACPDCSGKHDLHGWGFYAWFQDEEGVWQKAVVPCRCSREKRVFTKRGAEKNGWMLCPEYEDFPSFDYRMTHGYDLSESPRLRVDLAETLRRIRAGRAGDSVREEKRRDLVDREAGERAASGAAV